MIAFGEALREIYRREFGIERVWTLHEAADTTVFYPRRATPAVDVIWVGNWGDDERSREIREFFIYPGGRDGGANLSDSRGPVPGEGARGSPEARRSGMRDTCRTWKRLLPMPPRAPRCTFLAQQYTGAMAGIPTIRVCSRRLHRGYHLSPRPGRIGRLSLRRTIC